MIPPPSEKIIFVTGTDTGVGKTLLTASLLYHWQQQGVEVLAMKPFCSGGRADVDLIQAIQRSPLPDNKINPFYFADPVAPLVAARALRQRIDLAEVLRRIRRVEQRCERLIIEGCGGVMVPLGEGYGVSDLIRRLRCRTIVVAGNKLGTLNHTLLTVRGLQSLPECRIKVLLMDGKTPDFSARTNHGILKELLAPVEVLSLPYLGLNASGPGAIKNNHKKIKKVLAQLSG